MFRYPRFILHVFSLALVVIRKRKRETKRAYAYLDAIEKKEQGQFNPHTKKKIAVSYGIYLPIICDAFAELHGRATNEREKEHFIRYFICSSLFDDFTDYKTIPDETIQAVSFRPESF